METDFAVDKPLRRERDRRALHPILRSTTGTRSEHLEWATYLIIRSVTGIVRLLVGVVELAMSNSPRTLDSLFNRQRIQGTSPADLAVHFLSGKYAERQPDARYGIRYWSRWIGATARGSLNDHHTMHWTPDPRPGDPETYDFELNRAGDAATIHLRNVWRSGLIVRSHYGSAWFALPLNKRQIAFRCIVLAAVIITVATPFIAN